MKENKLADLSIKFSVAIIKLCNEVKGHRSLTDQIERSSTSIGANIHEANYAHSKADFIAKLQIALKECYETEYWLKLFSQADIYNKDTKSYKMIAALFEDCLSRLSIPLRIISLNL